MNTGVKIVYQRCKLAGMGKNAIHQHQKMGDDKHQKNRRHDHDGLFDASDIQYDQHKAQQAGNRHLDVMKRQGKIAEQRIHTRSDGQRDGQHIIHQQRTSGDNPRLFTQHVGGYDISAAAIGKMLDNSGIGV